MISKTETSKVIALHGLAKSGKTTVADFLEKKGYQRHSFATPLKNMLKCIGLRDEHLYGALKEAQTPLLCGKTPRFAMMKLGTEFGRDTIHPDIWIIAWINTRPEGNVVVDDLRFPNELQALTDINAVTIKIVRPGLIRGEHESEQHDLSCKYTVVNDGSLEDLYQKVDDILSQL